MAGQTFNVALVAIGSVQIAVVHIDAVSCSTPEMQARSMKFFQARLMGKQIVLMYVDLLRKPVFVGPSHLVTLLHGKSVDELRWQKAVMK